VVDSEHSGEGATMTTTELKTFRIESRTYDAGRPDPIETFDVTDSDFVSALRQMADVWGAAWGRIVHAEPINDVPGCSTFAVYERAPSDNGQGLNKIGCVYHVSTKPA
jgi:hypothetical protein